MPSITDKHKNQPPSFPVIDAFHAFGHRGQNLVGYCPQFAGRFACRYVLPIQFKLGEAPIAIKDKNGVYKNPEVMPEFPGGTIALLEFIAKNIRYPESAKASGIEGRVICSFVVGKDGQTRDVKLVRSLDPALDKEAMRVLSEQPRWTPGRHKGESVACLFTVPVSFRIK